MAADIPEPSLRWRNFAAAAIVLIVYGVCLYRLPTHTFWSPDEGCKLFQTETIHWDGGLRYALPYAGVGLDPDMRFYVGHMWGKATLAFYPAQRDDGTFRFHWPIWFSLLVKIPVTLFGPIGGFLVAMFAGWLVAVLTGMLAGDIDRNLAAPAILIVGLSTPVLFYSLCFWEHTTAVAFALLATLVLVRGGAGLKALLLCLPLAVAASMLRIELAASVAALCATFVVVARQRGASASTAVAGVADASSNARPRLLTMFALLALAIVLLTVIGVTLPDRHLDMLEALPARLSHLEYLPRILHKLTVPPWSGSELLENADPRIALAAVIACFIAPLYRSRRIVVPLTIGGLLVFAVFAADLATVSKEYRSLYGLFPIAPFMLLAVHAVRPAWRDRDSAFFTLTVATVAYAILGILALVMIYTKEDGQMILGLAWGPRYLLALYPLLTVLSLVGLQALLRLAHYRSLKVVVAGLAAVLLIIGVRFEVRGFERSRVVRTTLATWQEEMEGKGPTITDVWWLPAAIADFYGHEQAFAVARRDKVGDWVREAAAKGVSSFTFTSMNEIDPRDFGDPPPPLSVRSWVRLDEGLYLTEFSIP